MPDFFSSTGSLPNGRNLWSLVANQTPAIIADRLDNGVLTTGRTSVVSTLGASWTQTEYRLDGLNVTDPYATGKPLMNPDIDALRGVSALEVESGAGAILNLNMQFAKSEWHGAIKGFYSQRNLQSDNLDTRLRQLPFTGTERLHRYLDGSANLGRTLKFRHFSLPVFAALSTQRLAKHQDGFDAPISATVNHLLTRFSPIRSDLHTVNVLYAYQRVYLSHEEANPRTAASATTRGTQTFQQFQASWQDVLSPLSVMETSFGIAHGRLSSALQQDAGTTGAMELPSMIRADAAPFATRGTHARYEARALYSRTSGRLSILRLGGEFDYNPIANQWETPNPLQRVFIRDRAAEIILRHAPTQAHQHTRNLALFAQSRWRLFKRLDVNASLRFEQLSGKATTADNRINWRTLYPRGGVVLPLPGLANEEMVLRAGWSRYGYVLPGNYLDFGNPAALGEQVFAWADDNLDKEIQPQERQQLLRRAGGAYSAIDPHLRRPYADEIYITVEQRFGGYVLVRAKFFRRDDSHLIHLENIGVPRSSYTPQPFIDPGTDGIIGTGDDQTLTLFNRQAQALGKDYLLLTNTGRASYKGFQLEVIKFLAQQFALSANFSAMRTLATTNPGNEVFENDVGVVGALGTDPNTYLFANSRSFFDRAYTGKLSGVWNAPKDFRVTVVASYSGGLPYGRLLLVEGFNQGAFFIQTTPRGFRTQNNSTVDLRVAKDYTLQRGRFSLLLDFFNLLNQHQNTVEDALTSPTFAQRVPLAVQTPRLARLGVAWIF